ncbi:serine palmitoyltransferase 2 [Clavulina sp. PMI_390]|nr:serine palmitoyltransferase 2 [Clavulina sp. PMI_390]
MSRKLSQSKAANSTPVATPALSFSSSITASSASSTRSSSASSMASSSRSEHHHLHQPSSSSKSRTSSGILVDHALDDAFDDHTGLTIPLEPPNSSQVFQTVHAEFGHCANPAYRYSSRHQPGTVFANPHEEEPPYYILLTTYISYLFLICLGHMRDFLGKRFRPGSYMHLMPYDGYAALNSDFDSFYTRRLKARMDDCFSHPVTGVPGRTIVLLDRTTTNYNDTFHFPGTGTRTLNISSYNYLGFAQARGGCADAVEEAIGRYGLTSMGSRRETGTLDLHVQAERLVARFVGHEDASIVSMGFATNSTMIPALVSKGCLVISDELNHASIRYGVRISGASVRTYKHNDMRALEKLLREVISQGQPKTHRPWKKIVLIIEGLFSMEGTFGDLPAVMELKKKYKFYLYIDEAHSIGAIGPHGRGVCDYFGINPRDVDLLMGTFTKSFGAAGGYIAGSKELVDAVRLATHSGSYAEAISPVVVTQIVASISSIMGVSGEVVTGMNGIANGSSSTINAGSSALVRSVSSSSAVTTTDFNALPYTGPCPPSLLPGWLPLTPAMRDGSEGHDRLLRLAFNSRYLARGLKKLGFITYGHHDSPVVPLLLFNPGKMCMFHRLMLDRRIPITTVVVGYPATPLITSRVRFCVSASHTKADIDEVLRACADVGRALDLLHGKPAGGRWSVDEVTQRAVELVNM